MLSMETDITRRNDVEVGKPDNTDIEFKRELVQPGAKSKQFNVILSSTL